MTIEPINDQVYLIEEVQDRHVTASGIHIVSEAKSSSIGTIYAIGDNAWNLAKGTRVLFSRFAVEDVILKDREGKEVKGLKSLHIDQIHAILHDPK